MSDISQRIVTSHKEAAKRAAEYLSKARKLKLSSVESLELVARTLGVANWPTLQAMAKQGRGPRIDEGQAPATVQAPVAAAPEKTVVERLKDYYGTDSSWGECPDYPREQWRSEVEDDDTLLGYWEMVENMLGERGYMLPWERDTDPNVKLATEAGLEVVHASDYEHADDDEDNGWFVVKDGDALFDPEDSESEAWARAAKYVLDKQVEAANEGHEAYVGLGAGNVTESMAKASAAIAETPEHAPQRKPRKKRPGEMSDKARAASSDVLIARIAGKYVLYDVMFGDDFFPEWNVCDAKGEPLICGLDEEEEAWQLAAIEVRNQTCKELGRSLEEWRALSAKERFALVVNVTGLAEVMRVVGMAPTDDAMPAGAMSKEDREKAENYLSLARAAQTKVVASAGEWVISESCAREAVRAQTFASEQAAWQYAALSVIQEVTAISNTGFDAFVALPQEVRVRHVAEAYKGKTCWFL